MSEWKNLLVEDQEQVRLIKVNRPDALNALNEETLLELEQLLTETKENPEVGVVIITGSGDKAFVAGADINVLNENHDDFEKAEAFAVKGHEVFKQLEALPQPVIAAVNGYALGGGTELALSCDFVYASTNAVFGLPEVKLGLIPGFGGTQRLMRKIPAGMARELVYTGNFVKAEEAFKWGLANKVVEPEELLEAAMKTAGTILRRSFHAVATAKRVMVEGFDLEREAALQMEIDSFAGLFKTDHPREGTSAFLEKRSPSFSPRKA